MGMVVVNATFDWGASWSFFFFLSKRRLGFLHAWRLLGISRSRLDATGRCCTITTFKKLQGLSK